MDPSGEAVIFGVEKGDQLCEMVPVVGTDMTKYESPEEHQKQQQEQQPINMIGASFDFVMTAFASLDRSVSETDLVLFRGTKDELKKLCKGGVEKLEKDTITITVVQNKGSPQEELKLFTAPSGVNVRQFLVENDINVYQSIARWSNCSGKQLCGTCIINVPDGLSNTNWKSMDEASTLRSNPDSHRLSCVTFAHGDVTVEIFPPIKPDQWTR